MCFSYIKVPLWEHLITLKMFTLYSNVTVYIDHYKFKKLHIYLYAAAKSLQSCPTLCDPIDGSPPGSPFPGILQARTLEWVAISFSNARKWKVKVKSLSCVRLFATPWTAAYQAPPSMGFSRHEYWSGVSLPSLIYLYIFTTTLIKETATFVYIHAKSSSLFYQSGGKNFTWIGEKYLLILPPFYWGGYNRINLQKVRKKL